ncbi:putative transposase [Pseudomonas delhiensis]|uniref:Transposase n=1 Tax=Pseudomonas delhiensis TaxID=366289 RepID=A0A239NH52_9PSED|nr:transposase [Pseudomonas delhiensis]SDK37051.1 putative transposase [Pseudomonas delhiensis]SNT53449.1 putative transposase [Pseudomonas delhiensis]
MPNYRRAWIPGGTYFFTVTLRDRHSDLLVREIALLRQVVARARRRHPFRIDAWVVLPEHMHCLWTLPPGDSDFATRWKAIKSGFARHITPGEWLSAAQRLRGQRGIWQARYWEHLIRDHADYRRHFDYIHVNPLKHGLVTAVKDWPFSTFHRAVAEGIYPTDWAGDLSLEVQAAERH